MRWFLLATLLVTLAGCEYRYAAVANDKGVYVIDKKTGQISWGGGTFSNPPIYPAK